ncbi:MAG: hypothetical protein NTU95_02665 [Methanothrix sp.]|nr:hypothetical protein [Methanothrix sp.]
MAWRLPALNDDEEPSIAGSALLQHARPGPLARACGGWPRAAFRPGGPRPAGGSAATCGKVAGILSNALLPRTLGQPLTAFAVSGH